MAVFLTGHILGLFSFGLLDFQQHYTRAIVPFPLRRQAGLLNIWFSTQTLTLLQRLLGTLSRFISKVTNRTLNYSCV